jgi:hypothetical protein
MKPQLISDRNRSLWESIAHHFKIIIEYHPNDHFFHCINDRDVVIVVPEENGSIELFTHELLHVRLMTVGLNVGYLLKNRLRNEPLLNWTLNENLFEQVGHCLEHWKMLHMYLDMGFERDLFCESYYMPCCAEMSMQIIRSGMQKEIPSKASIDLFIHKYFAMRSCLNPGFKYGHFLGDLERVNRELFAILERFWSFWVAFDMNGNNNNAIRLLTYDFMHELGTWNIMNVYAPGRSRA